MKRGGFQRLRSALGEWMGVALAAAVVLELTRAGCRYDATREKLYTISAETRDTLRALPREVALVLYTTGHKAVPAPMRLYSRRIESLLRDMARESRGRIHFERTDPRPGSVEEQWADRLGLTGFPLSDTGDGARLFLGLAARSGARESVIPFLSPAMEPQLEYQVVRIVGEVSLPDTPRIGILSALPVGGDEIRPFGVEPPESEIRPAWTLARELDRAYRVDILGLNPEIIPDDLAALLVIHPRGITEKTLRMVDRYVVRGGRLIAFIDPLCLVDLDAMKRSGELAEARSDLNRLTEIWGLTMSTDRVALDRTAATDIPNARGGVERHPGWLTLRSEHLNPVESATATLNLLQIPFSGSFEIRDMEGLRSTVLLRTSSFSGWVGTTAILTGRLLSRVAVSSVNELPLAVRVEGVFPTAFPPTSPDEVESEIWKQIRQPVPEVKPPARGQVALIGDVDMLHDRYAIRTDSDLAGQPDRRPANSNLGLVFNLLEQMTGAPVLAGLRNRARFDRPLTRMLRLERTAAEEARNREAEIGRELEQVRRSLLAVRSKSVEDGTAAFAARQDEIERLSRQEREIEQRLFETRRFAQRQVERLGFILKVLNLSVVPCAVIFYGLLRGLRRRRRSMIGMGSA